VKPVGVYSVSKNEDESPDFDDNDDEQDPDDENRSGEVDFAKLLEKAENLSIPGFNKFLAKTGGTPSRPATPTADDIWSEDQDDVEEAPEPYYNPPSAMKKSYPSQSYAPPVVKPQPQRLIPKQRAVRSTTTIEVSEDSRWT